MNEDDTGELALPTDPSDSASDVLVALAAAAGLAGCLAWDVGPVFYFVPLGLAGAALALLIGSVTIANQVRIGAAIFATVAMIGSGAIGVSLKGDYDKLSDRAERAIDALDNSPY
jgi:hypothetical protein